MSQRFMAAAHFLRAGSIWMASAKCSRLNCQESAERYTASTLTLWTHAHEKPHSC